jgi:molybdenum cofactor cytidylyltransferase
MELIKALRLEDAPKIAFVGAGGKTTAIFQIAGGYTRPVIVTTSTHFSVDQTRQGDHHFIIRSVEDLFEFEDKRPLGINIITGPISSGRGMGLSFESLSWLDRWCSLNKVPLLIEADGSRRLSIKAPALHEPAIPPFVDTVLVFVGMGAVGKPLTSEWVHRPEFFAALSGLKIGDPIEVEAVIKMLTHPDGGLKNVPEGARLVSVLNQADTVELRELSSSAAGKLFPDYQVVISSSLNPDVLPQATEGKSISRLSKQYAGGVHSVHEPIAGIILAAGGARRFGTQKQLLPWHGKPLVRHVACKALEAGLNPVVLVVGAESDRITSAVADLPIKINYNPDWESGQGTSVRIGVNTLPSHTGGALFLLADQPQIPTQLIDRLITLHAETLAPITAPWVGGRQTNPTLFDKVLFPELMRLAGDAGGRQLFSHHEIKRVPWRDSNILLDVDTPEDYKRLLQLELM